MFHNLYPLSSTGYMNLGWALFLYDLITDEEIDVCSHIFCILVKIAKRIASRNCIPFCFHIKDLEAQRRASFERWESIPTAKPNKHPYSQCKYKSHKKSTKQESHATPRSSSSTSHASDAKLDNIMVTLQEINTKIFRLATIMNSQHIRFDTKFTSLQTQLDQIQRKLEEYGD